MFSLSMSYVYLDTCGYATLADEPIVLVSFLLSLLSRCPETVQTHGGGFSDLA